MQSVGLKEPRKILNKLKEFMYNKTRDENNKRVSQERFLLRFDPKEENC